MGDLTRLDQHGPTCICDTLPFKPQEWQETHCRFRMFRYSSAFFIYSATSRIHEMRNAWPLVTDTQEEKEAMIAGPRCSKSTAGT